MVSLWGAGSTASEPREGPVGSTVGRAVSGCEPPRGAALTQQKEREETQCLDQRTRRTHVRRKPGREGGQARRRTPHALLQRCGGACSPPSNQTATWPQARSVQRAKRGATASKTSVRRSVRPCLRRAARFGALWVATTAASPPAVSTPQTTTRAIQRNTAVSSQTVKTPLCSAMAAGVTARGIVSLVPPYASWRSNSTHPLWQNREAPAHPGHRQAVSHAPVGAGRQCVFGSVGKTARA